MKKRLLGREQICKVGERQRGLRSLMMKFVILLVWVVGMSMATPIAAQSVAAPATAVVPYSLRLSEAPGASQTAPVVGWTEILTQPRPLQIHFLRIDLEDPRIEPCVILAPDPDGDGPAEAALTKPLVLAEHTPSLLAAVNANAFAHLPGTTAIERLRGWYNGKPVDIAGLAVANGEVRSPDENSRTGFWFDDVGNPHLGSASDEQSMQHAVADWGALLLRDGAVAVGINKTLHPRTLAGFDASRRWLWLVVVDGRNPGVSEGMTLHECATLMQERGCSDAINLDGGGSSIMLQKEAGKKTLSTINRPSDGTQRPIPVMLGVREKVIKSD